MSAIYCITVFSIVIYILANVRNLINSLLCKDAFSANNTNDGKIMYSKLAVLFNALFVCLGFYMIILIMKWYDFCNRYLSCTLSTVIAA